MTTELVVRTAELPTYENLRFTDLDAHLFAEGTHAQLYQKLGTHEANEDGRSGWYFAVWAPQAQQLSLVGEFNNWNPDAHPLYRNSHGLWDVFIPGLRDAATYRYHITKQDGQAVEKADPFAFRAQSGGKASLTWNLNYTWEDAAWMRARREFDPASRPLSIYELHIGSWRRVPEEGNRFLTYREMAPILGDYLVKMNFTHVEFLPLLEHLDYSSLGCNPTGYFAPTDRYGSPQDLMFLIDHLHQRGIGVILDVIPPRFSSEEHGLGIFDGTHQFEHPDFRMGFHPAWDSYLFDYARGEVRSYLMSSATFWAEVYHADMLRVEGLALRLYRDYARKAGEWLPNDLGGRENWEAIQFLRQLNVRLYSAEDGLQTIAEEAGGWPKVSRPTYEGGLGFGLQWDTAWREDTLAYFSHDPLFRKQEHHKLTHRSDMSDENGILPFSHEEVAKGKNSLLARMPGDSWQKFANLRLLYGFLYSQPGKKLLFMGDEFGQSRGWNPEASLDWHELQSGGHSALQRYVEDLNHVYREIPALYERDFDPQGLKWIEADDAERSVLAYLRCGKAGRNTILVVCNFTPVVRENYRVGVPQGGIWLEILNSDAALYGGSGRGNFGAVEADPIRSHNHAQSLNLILPPLSALFLIPGSPERKSGQPNR